MRNSKIKFQLWDPLISYNDHKELKELGIQTLMDEPKDVKVALLCVKHSQFQDFFKNFNGVLYDYKNPIAFS